MLTLDDAYAGFVRRCQAKGLHPRSILFYDYRFHSLQAYVREQSGVTTVEGLTPDLIRGWLARERHVSPNLAKQSFTTVRAVLHFLQREYDYPAHTLLKRLDAPRVPKKLIATFTPAHITAMLQHCGKGFTGLRNTALLFVLLDCGLRATECCTLTQAQIRWEERVFIVWGKGDKERRVPFGEATTRALRAYLSRRSSVETPQVFVTVYGDPLTPRCLHAILSKLGTRAGVEGVRCSPHTFRHTCAVSFLRRGGDVFSLQKLLGHTDLSMTRRYVELSETDLQSKHRMASPGDAFLDAVRAPQGRKRLR
jgi:site-specific recombinase XerD